MSSRDIAVVGAGPSGLGAAYRLKQAGHRVQVFDARDYPGGKMRTTRRDGFLIDEGPQIMTSGYHSILGIARDAGMGDEILDAGSVFGYPSRDKLHYFDTKTLLRSALKFDLLSVRGKIAISRLVLDVLRTRSKFNFEDLSSAAEFDYEDAATYARRRSNEDVLEFVADPTIRALIGVSASEVSAVEFRYGFGKFMGSTYKAFRDGMGSYAHRIAKNFDMKLECTVASVEEVGEQARLRWTDKAGIEHQALFDGCVIATDGKTAGRIRRGFDDQRAGFLDKLVYTQHVNLTAALKHAPKDVPAMWINVPASIEPRLIVMTLEHNKHPNRAPAGKGLMHIDGSAKWAVEVQDKDDDFVIQQMMQAADRLLPGVGKDVEFAQVHRWQPMVLKAYTGYYRDLKAFVERCKKLDRRIQLAGDYFCQGSINAATAAGERAARDLNTILAE